jgi:hypothetical protein
MFFVQSYEVKPDVPSVAVWWLAFLRRIWEASVSNLYSESSHPNIFCGIPQSYDNEGTVANNS